LSKLPDGGDNLEPLTDCVLQSKASVSADFSDAFRCSSSTQNPEADCASELSACLAE
jgi:hypothetical protein